ncbi:MAG: hypothetical protein ABJA98_17180 [Acidobacteriota bacterium]
MHHRFLAGAGIVLVSIGVSFPMTRVFAQSGKTATTSPAVQAKAWKPARTPWGHPDLSGVYSNSDEDGIPFEKPDEFVGRRLEDITPAELDQINRARRAATLGRATDDQARPVDRLAFWEVLNSKNSRAWLVVDPPDGKVPPTTPEARQRAAARVAARAGRGPADAIEDRSLYDRCITRGVPGSMMPAIYGNSYEIVQGPQQVAIIYEMIHETRVIPLDNRPHVGKGIRNYMGDPRGHWDGDTLVVETTNFKDQSAYRNANGGTLRIVERFKPSAPDGVEWSVTLEDPSTWTRPWSFSMILYKKDASQRPFEYACHEGNYGMSNILSAARAEERSAGSGAAPGTNGR